MTDRASRQAREALEPEEGITLAGVEDEQEVVESLGRVTRWANGESDADPSAGDFVAVLGALDGEIAVEIDGEDYVIYDGGWRYIEPPSTPIHCSNHKVVPENWIEQADSVRLLHRDDTQELPGAVQEAMEGER